MPHSGVYLRCREPCRMLFCSFSTKITCCDDAKRCFRLEQWFHGDQTATKPCLASLPLATASRELNSSWERSTPPDLTLLSLLFICRSNKPCTALLSWRVQTRSSVQILMRPSSTTPLNTTQGVPRRSRSIQNQRVERSARLKSRRSRSEQTHRSSSPSPSWVHVHKRCRPKICKLKLDGRSRNVWSRLVGTSRCLPR